MNDADQAQGLDDTSTAWDLYREIHEAVRDALFGVATPAEDADAARADAVRRLLDASCRVALALDGRQPDRPDAPRPRESSTRCPVPTAPTRIEAALLRTDAVIALLHRLAEGQARRPRTRPTRKRA